ncbi:MAG: hypothetical protein Q8K26_00925, partial [Candidatus Gracilibacteria bacterium]|nr:hypothetical protein [Candidatus Gracilibacteria bacterium]
IVENYISGMYLDTYAFSRESMRTSFEHEDIEQKIEILAGNISNIKEKKYLLSLFERIKNHKPLFEPDTFKIDPLTSRVIPILSEEHKLFLSILDNQTLIISGKDGVAEKGEQKVEIKIGKIFANLLDMMSNYIIRKDSMERLSKINGNEDGAYWMEWELKKKVIK